MVLQEVIQKIQTDTRFDNINSKISSITSDFFSKNKKLQEILSGTQLGHPAHPAAVIMPLGAANAALILNWLGGKKSRKAARLLTVVTVLGAFPASATGISEWTDTTGEQMRTGTIHALINGTGIFLSAYSIFLYKKHPFKAKLFQLSSTALLTAGGYLGGHLSYVLGVGVNHNMSQQGPKDWTDITIDHELEIDKPTKVQLGSNSIVIVKQQDGIKALGSVCSHRGGPLEEGTIQGCNIICPWHQSSFCLNDGQVKQGPASIAQPVYEVKESPNGIQIRLKA